MLSCYHNWAQRRGSKWSLENFPRLGHEKSVKECTVCKKLKKGLLVKPKRMWGILLKLSLRNRVCLCGLNSGISGLIEVTSDVHCTEPSGFHKTQGICWLNEVPLTLQGDCSVELVASSELSIVEVAGVIWREILFVAKKTCSMFSV